MAIGSAHGGAALDQIHATITVACEAHPLDVSKDVFALECVGCGDDMLLKRRESLPGATP